jgi:hypothetical protein
VRLPNERKVRKALGLDGHPGFDRLMAEVVNQTEVSHLEIVDRLLASVFDIKRG